MALRTISARHRQAFSRIRRQSVSLWHNAEGYGIVADGIDLKIRGDAQFPCTALLFCLSCDVVFLEDGGQLSLLLRIAGPIVEHSVTEFGFVVCVCAIYQK